MKKNIAFTVLVCLLVLLACKKKDVAPATATTTTTSSTTGSTTGVTTKPRPDSTFTYSIKDTDLMRVVFTSNIKSNKAKSIKWTFGDMSSDSGSIVYHTYTHTGTYNVTLTVTDSNFTTSSSQVITFTESILQIHTKFGDMYMFLYRETPKHRHNYLYLAKRGYFDSSTFHRVVPNFVIQGGDPNSKDDDTTNDGTGGEDTIKPEIVSTLRHNYGMVGAARQGARTVPQNSNNSQFYIVVSKTGDHQLDGYYSLFGIIIKGMDVADKIAVQKADPNNNRPYSDIRMTVSVLQKTKDEVKSEYGFVVP